jgi:excisionase family DNA binding protein
LTNVELASILEVTTNRLPLTNKHGQKGISVNTTLERERWLTAHEASAYIGKSPKWLRENSLLLEIPHMRVGRQYRFKKTDLDRVFKVSV